MMTEEEKLEFYQSEYRGAPFVEFVGFRCTKPLQRFLETKAMIEGRDISTTCRAEVNDQRRTRERERVK